MCGITGTYGFGSLATLRRMTDAIAHRGPDGTYLFEDAPVFLGNRRLAIRDIAGGKQPMTNEDGSVVVVYNGEIYNYGELRDDLVSRGHVLKTGCDTEILPHMYEEFGVEFAARLNGIFAIALWDRVKRRLFLYRDPIGVKPLLYAVDGGDWDAENPRSGLLVMTLEGKVLARWSRYGYEPGNLVWPHDLAVGQNAEVFVAEVLNANRIQKFSLDCNVRAAFADRPLQTR